MPKEFQFCFPSLRRWAAGEVAIARTSEEYPRAILVDPASGEYEIIEHMIRDPLSVQAEYRSGSKPTPNLLKHGLFTGRPLPPYGFGDDDFFRDHTLTGYLRFLVYGCLEAWSVHNIRAQLHRECRGLLQEAWMHSWFTPSQIGGNVGPILCQTGPRANLDGS